MRTPCLRPGPDVFTGHRTGMAADTFVGLSTMPTCERIFIFSPPVPDATFIIQPVNVLHLADHDELMRFDPTVP